MSVVPFTGDAPPLVNLDAECALLGAIMCRNELYDSVADMVEAAHFAEPIHQMIWERMAHQLDAGRQVSPITLKSEFDGDPTMEQVGNEKYLASLAISAQHMPSTQATDYARLIRNLYLRRALREIASEAQRAASEDSLTRDPKEIIDELHAAVDALWTPSGDEGMKHISEAVRDVLESMGKPEAAGVPTKLADLDAVIGGLKPGCLYVMAGRPGMGKTALALHMAGAVASQGKPTLIFSLEMERRDIGARFLSGRTARSGHAVEYTRMLEADGADAEAVRAAGDLVGKLPVYVNDTSAMTVRDIELAYRREKRKHGEIGAVIVDYLGLLESNGIWRENRVQQISEMTRALKVFSRQAHVPVLVLQQLNRGVESRDDKRPRMSDLRDSGSIEQDADVVMLLYRPAYYLAAEEPAEEAFSTSSEYVNARADWEAAMLANKFVCEVNVDKNRHGPNRLVRTWCDLSTNQFGDMAR